jgi:hypothetical protein
LEPLFGDHAETVTFQLKKSGDAFVVRFVVKEGYEEKEDFVTQFKALQVAISQEVFDGAAIDLNLCDENLETKKEIKWGE